MSKLKMAEEISQREARHRTEEMALALATTLDRMRQAKVSTSEELAEVMYPLLQAMTSLALENQVLLKEMRLLMSNEMKQTRDEMAEMRTLMRDLKCLLVDEKTSRG